jgi:hypothetical protein
MTRWAAEPHDLLRELREISRRWSISAATAAGTQATGKPLTPALEHQGAVFHAAFSPNGTAWSPRAATRPRGSGRQSLTKRRVSRGLRWRREVHSCSTAACTYRADRLHPEIRNPRRSDAHDGAGPGVVRIDKSSGRNRERFRPGEPDLLPRSWAEAPDSRNSLGNRVDQCADRACATNLLTQVTTSHPWALRMAAGPGNARGCADPGFVCVSSRWGR